MPLFFQESQYAFLPLPTLQPFRPVLQILVTLFHLQKLCCAYPITFQIVSVNRQLVNSKISTHFVAFQSYIIIHSNRSIQNTLKLQQEAAELQKENNTARYAALQNQLNPHFLFNSLNTLIAEIEYNPSNAVRFTKHLSSVYRYVLQSQDKTLVPLNEELDFMKSYLFLHEVRLGNCISCECLVPDDYSDAMLPPLTLQLLVENVIKHNSITSGKPMRIHIDIENNYLIVSNPIQPKKSNDSSSGVGLNNLSNRCKLMLGEEIIVIKENNSFTVKVPLGYE